MFSSKRRAGATIGGIGLLLAVVHSVHLVAHDKPPLALIVGAVFPLGLSLLISYLGYWTTQQDFSQQYVATLTTWTVLGGAAMGMLIGTISFHQYLAGELPSDAVFQLAVGTTGGVLGGFLLGRYEIQMRRRSNRIEALQKATSTFVDAKTKTDVCEQTVQLAVSELQLPLTGAWLYNEAENRLEPVAVAAEGRETFDEHPTYEEGEGLSWDVFITGEPQVYDDLRDHPERYNPETPVQSEMILPLGAHGILNIGSREPNAFDSVDVSTAKLLAYAAGAVLDRAAREEQLRAQQRELEDQNNRLAEFSSVVSHDLRNPLTVAQGNLEVAKTECDSTSLSEIEAAHQRMDELIRDLLGLARAGQTVENEKPVSLRPVATDAWKMAESEAASLAFATDGMMFTANESRIRQLFENLFRNAIDHGGPDVTVHVGELDDQAGFYVEDDGPGIPPDDRDQVFDAGYTTHRDGTGLGLATVRRIATAHDWSITVTESKAGGARFEFRINQ
ncbi:GAF domain-containing sensor histidine kinase [Natronorubrum sulfidifaciens]|uniref:histidine kinase n=1 Tax=Natronorubrum sulfidifaciens JCM 14089 TaxID=1230460 RepID=L9VUH8_9EURY|nr:ATP-binding protein [Natronorubrum sulfidifaciens]ELY40681.1 HTR-like protein [Natronorubrum sulfidifaciens JCM 14089]